MLNFLKNKILGSENKEITALYENGSLVNVIPRPNGNLYDNREIYYNARYIVSDGEKYDLESIDSIKSIRAPHFDKFDNSGLGVTGNLVYVLRMKASGLKNEGKNETALALLKRATEMMPTSGILWNKKDYERFPQWLREAGEFEAAKNAQKCIDDLFKTSLNYKKQVNDINMRNANELGTDLMEAGYFNGCCGECAKYRGRWFSISGEDKRFPKMPVDYGCTCQGIDFNPVIYDISEPIYCPQGTDIITWSNRPFIDDRSDEEKETFNFFRKERENEEWFEQYRDRFERLKFYDRKKFEQLKKELPDMAPKSFNGYMRMKKSNSKNYQKLSESAAEIGIFLDYPEEMKQEAELLKPIKEQYLSVKAECNQYWNKRKNKK